MKQPRAFTQQRHSSKKSVLPIFRQPRTATTKLSDFSITNKNELFFNAKLIPFEIIAERKANDTLRILIGWSELSLFDNNRNVKIALCIDQSKSKDWIVVNFGESLMTIQLKKPGDDNVLVSQAHLISWERNELLEKRISNTINLKEIIKSQKTNEFVFAPPVNTIKDDKTKQMKAFVSNLMSKKIIRKIADQNEESLKIITKKNATLSKDKITFQDGEQNERSNLCKTNILSSACNGSMTLSILRSHRKDIIDRNKLKNSKFTGNSEKETSVGDQSIFLNQKVNPNITQMSNENGNYSRMKMKFDSQPYFYQNSTITSQFSQHNQNSTQNQIFFSRHEFPQRQGININFNSQSNTECLKDKSEHHSEEEVEEEIVRSAMRNSSLAKEEDGFSFVKKDKTGEETSECFESKQLESSEGTIYESKYE